MTPPQTIQTKRNNRKSENDEYLVALEYAENLHNLFFNDSDDNYKFSFPLDYVYNSVRDSEDNKIKIQLRKIDPLSLDVAEVYNKVSDAKVPKEYALSKVKLLAGIKKYEHGVNYLEQSYNMYLEIGTYTLLNELFLSSELSFRDGNDIFVEARNLLP